MPPSETTYAKLAQKVESQNLDLDTRQEKLINAVGSNGGKGRSLITKYGSIIRNQSRHKTRNSQNFERTEQDEEQRITKEGSSHLYSPSFVVVPQTEIFSHSNSYFKELLALDSGQVGNREGIKKHIKRQKRRVLTRTETSCQKLSEAKYRKRKQFWSNNTVDNCADNDSHSGKQINYNNFLLDSQKRQNRKLKLKQKLGRGLSNSHSNIVTLNKGQYFTQGERREDVQHKLYQQHQNNVPWDQNSRESAKPINKNKDRRRFLTSTEENTGINKIKKKLLKSKEVKHQVGEIKLNSINSARLLEISKGHKKCEMFHKNKIAFLREFRQSSLKSINEKVRDSELKNLSSSKFQEGQSERETKLRMNYYLSEIENSSEKQEDFRDQQSDTDKKTLVKHQKNEGSKVIKISKSHRKMLFGLLKKSKQQLDMNPTNRDSIKKTHLRINSEEYSLNLRVDKSHLFLASKNAITLENLNTYDPRTTQIQAPNRNNEPMNDQKSLFNGQASMNKFINFKENMSTDIKDLLAKSRVTKQENQKQISCVKNSQIINEQQKCQQEGKFTRQTIKMDQIKLIEPSENIKCKNQIEEINNRQQIDISLVPTEKSQGFKKDSPKSLQKPKNIKSSTKKSNCQPKEDFDSISNQTNEIQQIEIFHQKGDSTKDFNQTPHSEAQAESLTIQKFQEEKHQNKIGLEQKAEKEIVSTNSIVADIQEQLDLVNCTGEVASYCSQHLTIRKELPSKYSQQSLQNASKQILWLIPSLLLYNYCCQFYRRKVEQWPQLSAEFLEECQILNKNYLKIEKKCVRKNLMSQDIKDTLTLCQASNSGKKQLKKYCQKVFHHIELYVLNLREKETEFSNLSRHYLKVHKNEHPQSDFDENISDAQQNQSYQRMAGTNRSQKQLHDYLVEEEDFLLASTKGAIKMLLGFIVIVKIEFDKYDSIVVPEILYEKMNLQKAKKTVIKMFRFSEDIKMKVVLKSSESRSSSG